MGGLTIGVIWGGLVSAVVLGALSLSSPLPPRPDMAGDPVEVAVPAGEDAAAEDAPGVTEPEAGAAGEEEETPADGALEEAAPEGEAPGGDAPEGEAAGSAEADAPAVEEAPEVEEGAVPAETPEPEGEAAAEVETDTETSDSTPATEIPLPAGTEFNRPPPEQEAALPSTDVAPTGAAPLAPQGVGDVSTPSFDTAPAALPQVGADAPTAIAAVEADGAAPASPAAAPAPDTALSSGPSALVQPDASDTPQVRTTLLPQVARPEAEDVAAAADPAPVPLQTPTFPTIGDTGGTATATPDLPEEEVAGLIAPSLPQVSALPQAIPDAAPEDDVVAGDEPVEDLPNGPLPAIRANAVPFDDAGEERPLMAIVLIDEPDSRIELSTLTRFSFPVAFAVDPLHPDAATRAATYREAGFEVVILGSMFVDGATATDTEVAFAAAQATLPEAVALIDTPEGRIQGDRPVLDATVAALAESGHGLLAFPRGFNAAEQSANRIGVPGVTMFRLLDDENQRATVITRFLSRAAFTATQEGTVIVAGHTRPDTVTALFSWALGGRSEGVALAPLSATMLRATAP